MAFNAGELNLPLKFHLVDVKFMAKLHHLKEVIDYETDNLCVKPVGSQKRNKFHTQKAPTRHSLGHQFLDELTLWKTAVQIAISTDHTNKRARAC